MRYVDEDFIDYDKKRIGSGRMADVVIYRNPTSAELREISDTDMTAQFDELGRSRGILTLKGDLLMAMVESGEIIHDDLARLFGRHDLLSYDSMWESAPKAKYIAVWVEPDKTITVSPESYGYDPPENIEKFRAPKGYHLEAYDPYAEDY